LLSEILKQVATTNTINNSINTEETNFCLVSGLPITSKTEWTDINLGENYFVTFRLIGDRILLTEPKGNSGKKAMTKLFEKRNDILKKIGLYDIKHAEIRNYENVKTIPTKEGRQQLTDCMKIERERGNLLGFWGFNTNILIKYSYNIGKKLHKTTFPIDITNNYKSAINNAIFILKQNGILNEPENPVPLPNNNWEYKNNNYSISFKLYGHDIIYSEASGILKKEYVPHFFELLEEVLNETGLAQKGYYYRVANWEKLDKTTLAARKLYVEKIKNLNKKILCKYSVIYGVNKFMKVLLSTNEKFTPFTIAYGGNLTNSLQLIEKKRTEKENNIKKIDVRKKQTKVSGESTHYQ